jgi:hypothetical protein
VREPDRVSPTYHLLRKVFGHKDGEVDFAETLFGGSVDAIRSGILERVVHTPGVISTRVSESTASITMSEFKVPPLPESVKKMLADVRQRWVRPDGEELMEAFEASACAKNVGVGFHYYWHFPGNPDPVLKKQWYEARKAYNKETRTEMGKDIPKLDSPHLLENAAKRYYQATPYQGPLPVWKSKCWPAWAEIKDQLVYEPRANWFDDFFAAACAEWAQKNPHGIVWVESTPLGERIAKLSGCNFHRGGPNAEERILAERGDKAIIASISAHSQGRDGLQHHFYKGLAAEFPASGDGWHQKLGRYCRPGQKQDTIEFLVALHIEEFRNAMRNAFRYAVFDAEMNPNSQLLLAADIDFEL